MIDFTQLNTKKVIKEYKDCKIFPRFNSDHTLKYLKENFDSTTTTPFNRFSRISVGSIGPLDKKAYLENSLSYSIQSLIKGMCFFSFAESVNNTLNNCLSMKFLNLYYGHFFLSYSILQFHGILFNKRGGVKVIHLDLNDNNIISIDSDKSNLNHKEFWEIFYKIIEDSKLLSPDTGFMLDSIPNYNSSYFKKRAFSSNETESTTRNRNTYNYSSYFLLNKGHGNCTVKEKLKNNSSNQTDDYNKLYNIIKYEVVYLLGLLSHLSFKKDMEKELLLILDTAGFKNIKQELKDDIAEFTLKIKDFIL